MCVRRFAKSRRGLVTVRFRYLRLFLGAFCFDANLFSILDPMEGYDRVYMKGWRMKAALALSKANLIFYRVCKPNDKFDFTILIVMVYKSQELDRMMV